MKYCRTFLSNHLDSLKANGLVDGALEMHSGIEVYHMAEAYSTKVAQLRKNCLDGDGRIPQRAAMIAHLQNEISYMDRQSYSMTNRGLGLRQDSSQCAGKNSIAYCSLYGEFAAVRDLLNRISQKGV